MFIQNQYSVFKNQYGITKHDISLLKCIDILHP